LETQLLSIIGHIAVALLVLVLPGLTWLVWFPALEQDSIQQLAGAIGLSISLSALTAQFLFVLGWHLSAISVVALYALLGFLTVLGLLRRRSPTGHRRQQKPKLGAGLPLPFCRIHMRWHRAGATVLSLGLFMLLLFWRFYQVRNLALPAWVDSVHHALIVRLILEKGGLPQDLLPDLPVPFYYHFGFHVVASLFAFWTRLSPAQSILILGQILNAAVALSVYRLGMAIWSDRRRAGLAAVLVGFVSEMPAYYASWGRYTLLTGMLLLPLAMSTALEVRHERRQAHYIAELAMLTAGVLLSHYLAGLLLAIFFLVIGTQVIWVRLRRGKVCTAHWWALGLGAAGGLALASPWLWRVLVFAGSFASGSKLVLPLQPAGQENWEAQWSYSWSLLGPMHNHALVLFSLGGLITAAFRPRARGLALWGAILALESSPWGLRLSPFRPDHFAIVLFLPVCLLASDLFVGVWQVLRDVRPSWAARAILVGAVLSLSVWALQDTASVVNPATVLATPADMKALSWIEDHTPLDARFLINVTPWQAGAYRGVDGGYWILPYTQRQTVLPPAMYTWEEKDEVARINQLAEQTSHLESCTAQFWDLVRATGVTYLYATSDRGTLRPEKLASCPRLRLAYQADGVFIWQVSE